MSPRPRPRPRPSLTHTIPEPRLWPRASPLILAPPSQVLSACGKLVCVPCMRAIPATRKGVVGHIKSQRHGLAAGPLNPEGEVACRPLSPAWKSG